MEEIDWQNKHKKLTKRIFHTLQNKLYCDCEFLIGDAKIRCHKNILAASSPVFEAMFFGTVSTIENATNKIEVTDIDIDTFTQMIQYIYCDELRITSYKNACDVYGAANKYLLKYLMSDCVNYLSENIAPNNVLEIYEFAKFHSEDGLLNLCLTDIKNKTSCVLNSESLLCASKSTIVTILDMKELHTSTCELFRAVERWAKAQKEGCIDDAKELVQKIDLSTASPDDFISGPAKSDLLNYEEKFVILVKILKQYQLTKLTEIKSPSFGESPSNLPFGFGRPSSSFVFQQSSFKLNRSK